MIQKIRNYVNDLFADAPQTKKAMDLKEEVCSNLIDKFVDLTGQGMSEEQAYNAALASIGDIDELFNVLKKDEETENPKAKKRSAILVSVAVALYIISVIPLLLAEAVGYDETYGLVSMFILCAIATAMIIFNTMTRPKYYRMDDTMVEEFKEWKHQRKDQNSLYGAISGLLWTMITILYFVISFSGLVSWAFSWIIFLIGVAVQQIIRVIIKFNL